MEARVNADTKPEADQSAPNRPKPSSTFAELSCTSNESIIERRSASPVIEPTPRSRRIPCTALTALVPSATRLTSATTTIKDGTTAKIPLYVRAAA